MSTFPKNILLCLLLLGIPSVVFASGSYSAGFTILLIVVYLAYIYIYWLLFLVFKFFLKKFFWVIKTTKKWWQSFLLSPFVSVWLFYIFTNLFSLITSSQFLVSMEHVNYLKWIYWVIYSIAFLLQIPFVVIPLILFLGFYISHKIIK